MGRVCVYILLYYSQIHYRHDTLLQSDTVHPYGRRKTGTSPGGVGLRKKNKGLGPEYIRERVHSFFQL